MVGEIISVENGPQRNVKIIISQTEVYSEIAVPIETYDPKMIERYEVSGLELKDKGLVTLTLVLTDKRKILFYSTYSKFDMALLLDQLDGTIGFRPRKPQ